ncbi:MAG: universal stress protein [Dehalococcoidales bacterium]|jgi:nucleotide-binding universal stress UspA family protein|nr:universal stress protein [Dehalococcoidales bacterium]
MYERILVPLDGSKAGEAVLPYIAELLTKLASEVKIEIILFQVVSSLTRYIIAGESSIQVPYSEKEVEYIKIMSKQYLENIGESLKSKRTTIKTKVATGNAAQEIIRAADETKADMVAMSTHGRSGLARMTFGSITTKVVQSGNVPTLVVKAPKDSENT